MVDARRGWATLAAAGLVLAALDSWACRQEGANDATSQGGNAATTEPDGTAGSTGLTEPNDLEAGDAAITARVKGRLAADPRVSALRIDVDTQNAIVTLKGSVETEAAKNAAEEVARGSEGVVDVVNMIAAGGGGEGGSSAAGQGSER